MVKKMRAGGLVADITAIATASTARVKRDNRDSVQRDIEAFVRLMAAMRTYETDPPVLRCFVEEAKRLEKLL